MLGYEVSSSSLTPLPSRGGCSYLPFWSLGGRKEDTEVRDTGKGLCDWPCGKLDLCSLIQWIFKAVSPVGLFHGILGDSQTCGLLLARPWPDECSLFWQFLNLSSGHLQLLPCQSLLSPLKLTIWGQVISDPKAASSHLWPSTSSQKTLPPLGRQLDLQQQPLFFTQFSEPSMSCC